MIINNLAGGEVEITDIKRFLGGTEYDISDIYFGDKHIFESWRELESPLPITILTAGEDLIDYRIYGNTVQTGTPTPENPIMPSGCGERTENLYNKDTDILGEYLNTSGGVETNQDFRYSAPIPVVAGEYMLCNIGRDASGLQYTFRVVGYDQNGDYVEKQYSNTFVQPAYISPTFTIASGIAYVRLSYRYVRGCDASNIMLVKGSTAPASYIPYGYKLPMVIRSENIGILTANNLIFVNGSYTTIKYTKTGINIIISNYAANFCVFSLQSITSDMIGESFAVSWTGDATNACEIGLWDYEIAIGNKFVEITRGARVITITDNMVGKDIAIRFYFDNTGTYVISNFMFTAGSTAPTSYIPYYRDEENIYIGSDPLAEDEYVDYGKQKVYRMVNGILTPTDPPVPIPALPTIEGETIIDWDGSGLAPSQVELKYKARR